MPVAALHSDDCPFLLDDDMLRLGGHFALREGQLVDVPLGIRHRLSDTGALVVEAMRTFHSYGALRLLAGRNGARGRQFDDLIGFLNAVGALAVAPRPLRRRLAATVGRIRLLAFGFRAGGLSYRRRFTLPAAAAAACRATWPVTAGIGVIGVELAAGGLLGAASAAGICGAAAGTFVLGVVLHETGHAAAIGRRSDVHILQRGLRLGLIHARLPARVELVSALVGPLVGIAGAAAVGSALLLAGHRQPAAAAYGTALFHVFALLPWYGDGRSLALARSGIREERRP